MQEMWEDICLEKGTKEYLIEKTIQMQELWETISLEKGTKRIFNCAKPNQCKKCGKNL